MKPLTANLKIIFQLKGLWVLHIVFIGIYIGIGTSNEVGTGNYAPLAGIILLHLMYGAVIGATLFFILFKPFTFCLSDQIKAAQNMLLIIWLSLTVLFLTVFGSFLIEDSGVDYSALILVTGLITFGYWVGVYLILPKKNNFLPLLIFLILILYLLYNNIFDSIDSVIRARSYTWIIFFASTITSFFIYRSAGNKENFRNLRIKLRQGTDQNNFKSSLLPEWVNKLFLRNIKSNNTKFLVHLLGQVYLMIGHSCANWKRMLIAGLWIGFLMLKLFSGETEAPDSEMIIKFELAIIILFTLVYSMIFQKRQFYYFLILERKIYLWRRIFLLITHVFICLLLVFVLIYNQLFINIVPGTWKLLAVPTVFLPLFGGLIIILKKADSSARITSIVLTFFISVGLSFKGYGVIEHVNNLISPIILLSAALVTWGIHIAVLYYDSMKKSLC